MGNVGRFAAVDATRCRYFGGTTNLWGGACRPLDELDFVRRDWVAHSGWPFALASLLPYYQRARPYLGLPPVTLPNFRTSLPMESAGCDPEQGVCNP